jgi:hypothetical protein
MPGGDKEGGGLEVKSAYKKQKFGTPFKMKGSPMQRNFGIGSPLKDTPHTTTDTHKPHPHPDDVTVDPKTGVTTTRTKTGLTREKGDKKAVYIVTNTVVNKDGSKTVTLTNKETGHSYKEVHSSS